MEACSHKLFGLPRFRKTAKTTPCRPGLSGGRSPGFGQHGHNREMLIWFLHDGARKASASNLAVPICPTQVENPPPNAVSGAWESQAETLHGAGIHQQHKYCASPIPCSGRVWYDMQVIFLYRRSGSQQSLSLLPLANRKRCTPPCRSPLHPKTSGLTRIRPEIHRIYCPGMRHANWALLYYTVSLNILVVPTWPFRQRRSCCLILLQTQAMV